MARYSIRLVAVANVIATVEVEADSLKEASEAAVEFADGNASWQYDGLNTDLLPIEVVKITEVK